MQCEGGSPVARSRGRWTRWPRKTALAVGILVGATCLASQPAHAAYPVSDFLTHRILNNVLNAITNTLTGAVTQSDRDIVQAIQQLSGQNTSNAASEGKLLTNIGNLADKRRTQQLIDTARLAALHAAASGPASCNTMLGAAGAAAFSGAVAQWREQLMLMQQQWYDGQTTIAGKRNPASVSNGAAQRSIIQARCSDGFASEADVAHGVCKSAGQNPGADLDANTLFGSHVMSKADSEAAQLFATEAITPTIPRPIPDGSMASQPTRAAVAARNAKMARISVAQMIVDAAIARRQPLSGSQAATLLQQWAGGTGQQTPGTASFPNGVSEDAFMQLRARSFAFDADWQKAVATATPGQATKDLVAIESYRTWQDWKLYQLEEQQDLALAVLLSQRAAPVAVTK